LSPAEGLVMKTFEVVYEDDNILVINKIAGISVHKTHSLDPNFTLADALQKAYPYLAKVGEHPLRPGIVHRLDKETSGLMIVAKNNDVFSYFKKMFEERKIKKHYIALVYGKPKKSSGTITAPLGKIGTRQTTQIKGKRKLTERDAVTEYKTLKSFGDYTLLEVMPKTGRTHQIRVHLKSIGSPVVGDKIYGPKKQSGKLGLARMFLHAQRLEFTTPDGKSLAIESDLPEDLQKTLYGLQ
jgi:23S rRNA pseudouridine1911/1915/1917 synthase